MGLDLLAHERVVGAQQLEERPIAQLLDQLRRALDVREQDGGGGPREQRTNLTLDAGVADRVELRCRGCTREAGAMDDSEKIKFTKIELEETELEAEIKPVNVSIRTGVCLEQPHVITSRSGTEPGPDDRELIEEIEAEEEME
jgi:hypothetical protein